MLQVFQANQFDMHLAMKKGQSTLLLLSMAHYVAASKLQDRGIDLPVVEHVIPIRGLSSSSSSQLSGRDQLLSSRDIAVSEHITGLRNARDIFGVDVQVRDEVSTLIFNTGVPFTLVFAPGFQCLDVDGNKL